MTYSNQKIRGIIFDKDGTLVDFHRTWLPRYQQIAQLLSEQAGYRKSASELLQFGGYIAQTNTWVADSLLASGSNAQILDAWERHLNIVITQDLKTSCRQILLSDSKLETPVLDNLDALLSALNNRHITLGLATMDDEVSAVNTLRSLNLSSYFDFVCGADSGHGVKPQPGMIQAFCRHTGCRSHEVIMVGDSPRDLKMGKNAGVAITVGVLTGAHSADDLRPLADHILDDVGQLLELV